MNKFLMIIGLAVALGACSSPEKKAETVEETPMEAAMDSVITEVDSLVVEMDSVMTEVVDSLSAE